MLQEFVAIAGSEALRNNESDSEKRKYPGGAFDPLGFTKDAKVASLDIDRNHCHISKSAGCESLILMCRRW